MEKMIEKGDDRWNSLHKNWIGEKKPGYITAGGSMYRVFVDNDEVKFLQVGTGIDDNYGTRSTKSLAK